MTNRLIQFTSFLLLCLNFHANNCFSQEGFYTGLSWNTYFVKDQVSSADNTYQFTYSNSANNNGFLTQSLGDFGVGLQFGVRKNLNLHSGRNLFTVDAQYYYNYQNVELQSNLADFEIKTKANYNHGFRVALGHHFGKIHPYLIVQGFYQNINIRNTAINNGGIIYDVDDDGTILSSTLDDDGGSFTNEVFSFLGGFGLEIPLDKKFTLNMEYIPMKLVEFGLQEESNPDDYFVHNLTVNQLQVGVRYYFANILNF